VDGTPFGRYQLIELLGRGGMGEVWRAHDTTIDRVVAIKTLLPHYAKDPVFDKRFRREARTDARLDHPHVVRIHDVGEIDGRLYVTMGSSTASTWTPCSNPVRYSPNARSTSSSRSRPHCTPPTAPAWCTATSNRPIFCWPTTTSPTSSISASPAPPAPR
jgi:serine/threonine protein kinase